MSAAMLPSEKLELAIYKFVDHLGPFAVSASITQLSQVTGEKDYGRIVERLKDLEVHDCIALSKFSGGRTWPRSDSPDQTFFYAGAFLIEIAPRGRKYFEELEQRSEGEEERLMKSTKEASATEPSLLVFISHSSKDRALAEALTDLLKSALGLFSTQIRCSSVDGQSKLREEVNAAKVVVGLVTPSSLTSSYVMFELGARWGADLFLAPLLAGVRANELSGPLGLLNALSAGDDAQLHQLLGDIAEQLGLPLQKTESYIRHVANVMKQAGGTPNTLPTAPPPIVPAVEKPPEPEIRQVGAVNYYFVGDKGPYCQPCYDEKGKRIVLTPPQEWNGGIRRKCEVCNKFFYEKPMTDFPGPIFVRG